MIVSLTGNSRCRSKNKLFIKITIISCNVLEFAVEWLSCVLRSSHVTAELYYCSLTCSKNKNQLNRRHDSKPAAGFV